jgi:hypothetical protein
MMPPAWQDLNAVCHVCHWAGGARPRQPGPMAPRSFLTRLCRRLRAAGADIAYAQRRGQALALSYERHLLDPEAAPADYGEFLLRSSVPLLHEPSAAERLG